MGVQRQRCLFDNTFSSPESAKRHPERNDEEGRCRPGETASQTTERCSREVISIRALATSYDRNKLSRRRACEPCFAFPFFVHESKSSRTIKHFVTSTEETPIVREKKSI